MLGSGAIVLGGYINALGLVRALAARGVPTAVVTTKPYDIAHRSRWVSASDAALGVEDRPGLLVERLERLASGRPGWAVLPTNDEALAALAGHHDRLSSRLRLIAHPPEVARYLLDKALLAEEARAVGAEPPRCYGPAAAATAELPDVSFPVVVKPLVSYRFAARFGAKLFVADDREELRAGIARMAGAGIPGQVLDFVPGPDDLVYAHCTYVDARGEPLGGLTIRKVRQGPPRAGDARVAELAGELPELREATVELTRRIGLRGIVVAEFKLDPRDGRFRFIELNGRSVVYNGLLRRGGLDLGWLAWSDHMGLQPRPARPNAWPGVWVNLHADVLYSLYARRQRPGVAGFLAPYARPTLEAVWCARDPRPFLTLWSRTARDGATAVWHGTHGELGADRTRVNPGPLGRP